MNHSDSLKVTAYGDLEVHITRTFAGKRELVFEAMCRADLLQRWMSGPPGWEMTECENDVTVGGRFRHVWRGPDAVQMSMTGVYQEVQAPERVVRTERFDTGCEPQAGEQVATLLLEEEDDGDATRLRIMVRFPSKEARDGALASGMDKGLEAGYAKLDAELKRLAG